MFFEPAARRDEPMTEGKLAGRRVLVVEDDTMVALVLETALEDAQCIILGPFGDLAGAMAAAQQEAPDLAVLDINLGGAMVFPLAELLDARGVPFLLLSGYGDAGLPEDKPDWPVCAKPFKLSDLIAALARLLEGRGR
jgi:DNA-binding NtrC family response regulator